MIYGPLDVDQASPIGDHDLNRDTLAWWLALPQSAGGPSWYSLTGANPAVFTNMTGAASGWKSTGRQGGFGQVQFDGTDDYAAPAGNPFIQAGSTTIAAWVRPSVTGSSYWAGQWSGAANRRLLLLSGLTAGKFQLYASANGTTLLTTGASSVTLTTGNWYRILGVVDTVNSVMSLYVNGVLSATSAGPASLFTGFTGGFRIGGFSVEAVYANGAVDDVHLWARALSAAEAAADYSLGQQGLPGVLRRHALSMGLLPAGSTTVFILPTAIGSGILVSSPVVSASATIIPTAIATQISVPSPALSVACVISPAGISSQEAVGSHNVGASCTINPAAIASRETFGSVIVTNNGTVNLPIDLLAAIQATILASPGVANQFTGGIWSIKADDSAVMPYVVIRERSSMTEFRSIECTAANVTIETRAYAPTTDLAGALADALRPILEDSNNTFAGAAVSPLIVEGDPRSSHESGRARGNTEIRYTEQLYHCRVIRTKG